MFNRWVGITRVVLMATVWKSTGGTLDSPGLMGDLGVGELDVRQQHGQCRCDIEVRGPH